MAAAKAVTTRQAEDEMSDRNTLKPIRQAALAVHKGRDYVRKLVEAGEVQAFKAGGSNKAPRLLVDPAEVEAAIRRLSVYVPAGAKTSARRTSRRPGAKLHPAAAMM